VNARDVETGWLHQQSLDGVTNISVDCEQIDLTFESDDTLSGFIQLIAEPAQNLPVLERSGSEFIIRQRGRYRGRVKPLLRVPARGCPDTGVKLDKGDLVFQDIGANVAVKLGMGDVSLTGGVGSTAVSIAKGDVTVTRRDGNSAIKAGMSDISINECAGLFAISCGKGDVQLDSCGPDIEVKTGHGDVLIASPLGGVLSVSSGNGDIVVRDGEASSALIRTGKGDISSSVRLLADHPDFAAPNHDDDDDFTDFDDFAASDSFSIGDIEIEAGDDGVRIGRGSRNILRMGPEGIQIRGSNREISLGPDGIRVGGPEPVDRDERFLFETSRGDVQVSLPGDLNVRVEVLATGDIQSDVPLVSVARPGPRGSMKRLVGVTNGAGKEPRADVRVRTNRGDVQLRMIRVLPRTHTAPPIEDDAVDRDEQARVILEALARGDLSIREAERLLEGLDRGD
jgi:hypothetical protein